jgi:hypothetical protein
MVVSEIDPGRLVFVDERGAHTSLAPLYGYSDEGDRLRLWVPRLGTPQSQGKNTTLLAAMTLEGMGETMAVEGATDRARSSRPTWSTPWEHALAGAHAGIWTSGARGDNLSAHKPARVREIIEQRGCEL